jgi:hypothetical protein
MNFFKRLIDSLVPKRTYRRSIGKSVWHSSNQCKNWPTENFEETTETPQFGGCPICVEIEHRTFPWYRSRSN